MIFVSTSTREGEDRLLKLEDAQRRWDEKLSRLEGLLRDWQKNLQKMESLSQTTVLNESNVLDALPIIKLTIGLEQSKFIEQLQGEVEDLERELSFLQEERRELEMRARDYD